jgi:transcription elongation factor Elf1
MFRTDSEPVRVSHYSTHIECPQCDEKMVLHIGLTGDTKNNALECPICCKPFVVLVPGPITGGPFPAMH